jgi:hypothetical protein
MRALAVLLAATGVSSSFTHALLRRATSTRPRCAIAASDISPAIFQQDNWPALAASLDQLPVFTVANAEGQPLQYEIDGNPLAMFYVDVEAAKKELESAQQEYPTLGCDLIPVGVGSAFKLTCEGKAALLPSEADLAAAGAPPGTSPMGQALPLFACMEMSQESASGTPRLPLFMAWADCAAAVSQATQTDAPEDKLEIVGLSLPSVVERLGSMDASEEPAFIFIPPTSSSKFIAEYMVASGGPPISTGGE